MSCFITSMWPNSSWVLTRQPLKFLVEPCWQYALLKQQCVDTVPAQASRFTSRTTNGTTSSTCWAPSHPITHSQRLLKILDTVAKQSICCLLALTGFHSLLSILGMMSPVWSMGSSTSQLQSDNDGSFFSAQMNWEQRVCMSYLQAGVGPWIAEVVESPWLRCGVNWFPLEVWGHSVAPRKLEYSHGNRTFFSTTRYMQGRRLNKSPSNKCSLLVNFLLYK